MVLEYQGFLASSLRAREVSEATKADRKGVSEIMETATQASISCQKKSQTSLNLPAVFEAGYSDGGADCHEQIQGQKNSEDEYLTWFDSGGPKQTSGDTDK